MQLRGPVKFEPNYSEVIPSRGEIRVRTDDGQSRVMTYSASRITVAYHGWDYTVENLAVR